VTFELWWPPPEIREAIANILGALDAKMALNRRMNQTLEAMARAIFKSWFVDFDPVRARAEGRQPFGMDAETAALFPDSFQDSPLGKIPKGWKAGHLGEIAENPRRGVSPGKASRGTPYIGLEHMPRKCIGLESWGQAEEVGSNKFEFRQGEILFGKLRPYFHKVGVAVQDGVCSTDILVVRPKSKEWYGFVLGHVSSGEFVNYTDAVSTGTKMPRTNWQDMARYQIPLPEPRLANAYSQFASRIVEMIRQNILQSRTLAMIRDALLPKLISGAIRGRMRRS
jgi:type I restriction enzyme S subunit